MTHLLCKPYFWAYLFREPYNTIRICQCYIKNPQGTRVRPREIAKCYRSVTIHWATALKNIAVFVNWTVTAFVPFKVPANFHTPGKVAVE